MVKYCFRCSLFPSFVCLFTISAGKVDPDDLSCSVGHDFSTFASLSPAQQALDMAAAREAIDSCSLAHHFTLLLLLTGMFVLWQCESVAVSLNSLTVCVFKMRRFCGMQLFVYVYVENWMTSKEECKRANCLAAGDHCHKQTPAILWRLCYGSSRICIWKNLLVSKYK